MKRTTLINLAIIFGVAFAYAAQAAETSTAQSVEAELIALGQAWIDAEVGRDRNALERILDDDFLATFSSGKTIDRNSFIDFIMNAEIPPFKVVNDFVRVHGDTALVIDLSEDGKSKYTWIAVKRDGYWRVISETFTSVK